MLVLSRKLQETILIEDLITITVVRIGPNSVRLGIDAPRELNIRRGELVQTIPAGPSELDVPLVDFAAPIATTA